MNKITINGKAIRHSGSGSVCISNGKMTIGGVDVSELDAIEEKQVTIIIHGDVENLSTDDSDVTVNGHVGSAATKNGNISCGNVSGGVETKNGNVSCGHVEGDVNTKNGNISHR